MTFSPESPSLTEYSNPSHLNHQDFLSGLRQTPAGSRINFLNAYNYIQTLSGVAQALPPESRNGFQPITSKDTNNFSLPIPLAIYFIRNPIHRLPSPVTISPREWLQITRTLFQSLQNKGLSPFEPTDILPGDLLPNLEKQFSNDYKPRAARQQASCSIGALTKNIPVFFTGPVSAFPYPGPQGSQHSPKPTITQHGARLLLDPTPIEYAQLKEINSLGNNLDKIQDALTATIGQIKARQPEPPHF